MDVGASVYLRVWMHPGSHMVACRMKEGCEFHLILAAAHF
jgi:hypothetical protein